jgi:hypothetical protein
MVMRERMQSSVDMAHRFQWEGERAGREERSTYFHYYLLYADCHLAAVRIKERP